MTHQMFHPRIDPFEMIVGQTAQTFRRKGMYVPPMVPDAAEIFFDAERGQALWQWVREDKAVCQVKANETILYEPKPIS